MLNLNHVEHSSLDDINFSLDHIHGHRSRNSRSSSKHGSRRHSHSHKRRSSKFKDFSSHQCAVCLDESQLDTKLLPCGHTFHGECLITWANVQQKKQNTFNCPLCRQEIAHFIQMTGNQAINDQLIEIWNRNNLKKVKGDHSECDHDKSSGKSGKSTVSTFEEIDVAKTVSTFSTEEEEVEMKETQEAEVETKPVVIAVAEPVSTNTETSSIWKFLWKSPLSPISKRVHSILPFEATSNGTIGSNLMNFQMEKEFESNHLNNSVFGTIGSNANQQRTDSNQRTGSNSTNSKDKDSASYSSTVSMEDEAAVWKLTPIHFKAGLWAGLCAGSTTFFLQSGSRMAIHSVRSALMPILAETVPSVAIFFTTYEHCKRSLTTDNEEDSGRSLFCKRFVSAGIASSLGFVAPNMRILSMDKGLLPFRFATFFGTFELCKDAMNVDHGQLGLLEVASAAAIGGTVSHGLYYPLLQSTSALTMEVQITGSTLTKQFVARNLYKGWVSSLNKFLPSCVVCSCAFEYGKRYLNK